MEMSTPIDSALNGGQLSPEHIMQVGLGFWASKTLLSAIEMELFTQLANHPQDLETPRGRAGLHPRSARDFLDALVALGFLERTDGMYGNAPETDLFLDKHKPSYVGGILEMAEHSVVSASGTVLRRRCARASCRTRPRVVACRFSKSSDADPARLRQFAAAMTGISHGASLQIAAQFPWGDYTTFADVGAAQGDLAVQVALAHPHLTGCGFDLPQIGPVFEEYVEQNGLAGRLAFVPGDFFTGQMPTAEVLMMGHILHDWDADEKRTLLAKAYDALPDGGALIVYDAMIDDDRSQNAFGLLMSLNMLIETTGGFGYTTSDCIEWMQRRRLYERTCRASHRT